MGSATLKEAAGRLEACSSESQHVETGSEVIEAVASSAASDGGLPGACALIAEQDAGRRNRGAGGIGDGSDDGAVAGLGAGCARL